MGGCFSTAVKTAEEVVSVFDADGDGELDEEEQRQLVDLAVANGADRASLEQTLRDADTDGDGKLSRAELGIAPEAMRRACPRAQRAASRTTHSQSTRLRSKAIAWCSRLSDRGGADVYHSFLGPAAPEPSARGPWTKAWAKPQPGQLQQAIADAKVRREEVLFIGGTPAR